MSSEPRGQGKHRISVQGAENQGGVPISKNKVRKEGKGDGAPAGGQTL